MCVPAVVGNGNITRHISVQVKRLRMSKPSQGCVRLCSYIWYHVRSELSLVSAGDAVNKGCGLMWVFFQGFLCVKYL